VPENFFLNSLDLRAHSRVYTVFMNPKTISKPKPRTISKLAGELGVRTDTIRYYERIGLLPEPVRTSSNYRLYDEHAAERMRFIKSGQRLGLRLDEIRELLNIRDDGMCPCGHTASLLKKRISALDEELARLSELRNELGQMVEKWPGDDNELAGRWHCAGEIIPIPDGLEGWLCKNPKDCMTENDHSVTNGHSQEEN